MAAETTEGGIEELSAQMQRHPRDLLRRFSGTICLDEMPKEAGGESSSEIKLSLGLSLGGCFGVEPGENRLVRSSSIATLSMFPEENELAAAAAAAVFPIARTCSLPVGSEEEHRKRKELQSLKRLEAKRKRSEKRKSRSEVKDPKEDNLDDDSNDTVEPSGFPGFPTATLVVGVAPPELPVWPMTAGRVDAPRCFGPGSQGSIGSQGSTSSSVSDFESRMLQGFDVSGLSSCTEVRSPSIGAPLLDRANQKPATTTPASAEGKPVAQTGGGDGLSKKKAGRVNGTTEVERSMMEEMPCVTTKGDGPNGRRIEGFLYKYRKGEEVRIVCVCHGSFLTPAEFVRHAGGSNVDHPLRHIVVSSPPPAFL